MTNAEIIEAATLGLAVYSLTEERRARSIAADLGATVDFVEVHEGQTVMRFTPPMKS